MNIPHNPNPPLISIIIPNYNHTRFLGDAIQSALAQTYPSKEIIVVDDGSTDNCREVITGFGDQVRYIWQENQGLAGARNTGIRGSNGELIGLLDADDQWLPEYLEKMVALSNQYPNAAVYYCQTNCIDIDGNELPQVLGGPPIPPGEIYWELIRSNFIIPSTVLLRKPIITDAGLFDQSLRSCEDWDLWLRLLPENEIVGSSQSLVRYRIHDNSLSKDVEGMHKAAQAVIKKNFGEDDNQYDLWTMVKRRAYGGLYWYQAWTSITRVGDWNLAGKYISKAIIADPTFARDIDFFYELALGAQPTGYRGSSHALDIRTNVSHLHQILNNLVDNSSSQINRQLQTAILSTAYYSFGILAYNTDQFKICRMYLNKALRYRLSLVTNRRFITLYTKSLMGTRAIKQIRSLRGGRKIAA